MSGYRNRKVAVLLRDELSALLRDEVDETRKALVTITDVMLSADLQHARVFVSIFPETADRDTIMDALGHSRGRLMHALGRVLRLRRVPELDFRLDDTAERSARIEELLAEEAERSGTSGDGDSE